MMRNTLPLLSLTVLLSGPVAAQPAYIPGPDNVALPADYQTRFVRYSVVD